MTLGLKKDRTYSVLFIGNSYTYYNSLWDVFQQLSGDAGYSFSVDQVTSGGYYLDQFTDLKDPYGKLLETKLAQAKYDYAFLQEQSRSPIMSYDRFEAGAAALCEKLAANGARAVLYETWGRKTGADGLIGTNESMSRALAEAYERLGRELGLPVSPVGRVFYEIYTKHPKIELYNEDGSHPSAVGTYVAALCHFVTLTGEDPAGLAYHGALGESEAAVLKELVYGIIAGLG